jgi:hypothetical protein
MDGYGPDHGTKSRKQMVKKAWKSFENSFNRPVLFSPPSLIGSSGSQTTIAGISRCLSK